MYEFCKFLILHNFTNFVSLRYSSIASLAVFADKLTFEGADPCNWLSNVLKKQSEDDEDDNVPKKLAIPTTCEGKEYMVNNL